jgi:hypothetical protein
MHPKAATQAFIGTEIEEPAGHEFLGEKIRTVHTDLHMKFLRAVQSRNFGHIFRGGWHEFQGIFLLVISVQS